MLLDPAGCRRRRRTQPRRAALHHDDRVVAILADRGGGESEHVPRRGRLENAFEAHRGDVMALIDDHVAVAQDLVGHGPPMHEALEHRHVDLTRDPTPTSADLTQRIIRELEERRKLLPPLVKEVTSVDDDEGIDSAGRDHGRGKDGLPESSRCGEHTGVVPEEFGTSAALLGVQLSEEAGRDRPAGLSLVTDLDPDAIAPQEGNRLVRAAARQRQVPLMILGPVDDPRLAKCREPHRLGRVEVGVLKRGDASKTSHERRRQALALEEYLTSEDDLNARR